MTLFGFPIFNIALMPTGKIIAGCVLDMANNGERQ
jgi:hypothetical protein